MMAFASSEQWDLADALLETQRAAVLRNDDNAMFTVDAGHAATRAMLAFARHRYAEALELLRPVRHVAHRFGGSHAQRDAIDLTMIEAARRSGQTRIAMALVHERERALEGRRPHGVQG